MPQHSWRFVIRRASRLHLHAARPEGADPALPEVLVALPRVADAALPSLPELLALVGAVGLVLHSQCGIL